MKKGFTLVELIGVIIILALIMLLAVPPILNSIRSTRNELSDASKKIIYTAANLYVSENLNDFPKYDGNTFCVSIDTLSKKEYLPTIVYDSTTGDEIPKDSLVEIKVENNNYTYNMNNGCIEYIYDPYSLINILLKQYSEGNTKGLVKDATNDDLYYYTGLNREITNNYLWYGGHQWRVLEFDTSAKTLTLISQQPLTAIQPANSVWTTQEAYESSYINTWLNDYFYNSLDSSIQSNIQKTTFNVGIYTNVGEIKTEQKVGLLDEEQYKRAGGYSSFLDIDDYFWFGNTDGNSNIRRSDQSGGLGGHKPIFTFGVRPVIKILDITIAKGDGTLSNSYQTSNRANNTSNVQVGEYINVPYAGDDNACGNDGVCTFRVVSKNNDSIKVTLNGLLPKIGGWADDANDNITTSDKMYTTVLNGFVENISSEYITTGTFGVGMYASEDSYVVPQSTTISASVGSPTIGEMFTCNDIDLSTSSTRIFVDVNTLENPTSGSNYYYWTMNRKTTTSAIVVSQLGDTGNFSIPSSKAIRPTIYLKSWLTFTGGEGTAQSPYILQ